MLNSLAVFAAAAGLVAAPAAAPAAAVTFDAFTTFDGTQNAGNFVYGYSDFTSGTLFGATGPCAIAGSVCLQEFGIADVPGVYKSTTTSFQYGTVNVPNDRLLVHPGPNAGDPGVFIAFVAPTAGSYSVSANFSVLDTNPTGVNLTYAVINGGVPTLLGAGALTNVGNIFNFNDTRLLAANDVLVVVVDRAGNYSNDSTGVNFAVTLVPEPATWALMIGGFAMTGFAARRRRIVAA